jgi:hypothetical protein
MVAPPRAHPRAPGQTTSRLRLRRFRPDHNGVALKHGCAIAPLASKRSDHRQDDQHDGLQEDGNDLLISMSELIFNGEHRPIALESVAKLAAGVIQRVFVLAGYRSPLNSRTNPRPSYGLCGGSTFPCASQPFIASDQTPHNPLRHSETRRRRHLFDDHKGIYARGLPHSKSFLGSNGAHARALSAGQVLGATDDEAKRRGNSINRSRERPGGGWGGRRNQTRPQISTSPSYIAPPCSKFWAALGSKKSGGL